ncbi:hypothetical protein PYCC9005_002961 [Savitreella phatthalungensis]
MNSHDSAARAHPTEPPAPDWERTRMRRLALHRMTQDDLVSATAAAAAISSSWPTSADTSGEGFDGAIDDSDSDDPGRALTSPADIRDAVIDIMEVLEEDLEALARGDRTARPGRRHIHRPSRIRISDQSPDRYAQALPRSPNLNQTAWDAQGNAETRPQSPGPGSRGAWAAGDQVEAARWLQRAAPDWRGDEDAEVLPLRHPPADRMNLALSREEMQLLRPQPDFVGALDQLLLTRARAGGQLMDFQLETELDMHGLIDHPADTDNATDDCQSCFITAHDVARGVDPQGFRWKRGPGDTRAEFRSYRVDTYECFYNWYGPYKGGFTECSDVAGTSSAFVDFCLAQTRDKCGLVHFQLRNLVSAGSGHGVHYTAPDCRVRRYDPYSRNFNDVLQLSKEDGLPRPPYNIASMAITPEYSCVGGFLGEYALKMHGSGETHAGIVTDDTMGITNHIDARTTRSGSRICNISSNDNHLRILDIDRLQVMRETKFQHALNCSATSTDGRMQVVVGDTCDTLLVEAETGEILRRLEGHWDYSFACAWSSDGHTFATGSQDRTTRVYDARNTVRPLNIYKAVLGAIRSCKFSPCGRFLAVAEPADFVHIYDLKKPGTRHTLDFFGEVAGIDWSPTTGSLFVGNADLRYGGITEYTQRVPKTGLEDALL